MTATCDLAVGVISGGRQPDCGPRLSDGVWDGNVEALAGRRAVTPAPTAGWPLAHGAHQPTLPWEEEHGAKRLRAHL